MLYESILHKTIRDHGRGMEVVLVYSIDNTRYVAFPKTPNNLLEIFSRIEEEKIVIVIWLVGN